MFPNHEISFHKAQLRKCPTFAIHGYHCGGRLYQDLKCDVVLYSNSPMVRLAQYTPAPSSHKPTQERLATASRSRIKIGHFAVDFSVSGLGWNLMSGLNLLDRIADICMLHCGYARASDAMAFLCSNPQRHPTLIFPLIKLNKADLNLCVR